MEVLIVGFFLAVLHTAAAIIKPDRKDN